MKRYELDESPIDDWATIATKEEFFDEVKLHGANAWMILRRCTPTLQDNNDVVLKAIELDPMNFEYASDRLKASIFADELKAEMKPKKQPTPDLPKEKI